jgi:GNAT superfamily N-acetyltransferase
MPRLPESLFLNPAWHALQTRHRHLAVVAGDACRYPADVAPFGAVAEPRPGAMRDLHSLLLPGESVWIFGEEYPPYSGLSLDGTIECLQMVLDQDVSLVDPTADIVPLSNANAPEMVALTDLAFPGFFRPKTHEMGFYYGVRSDGELIAMGGERLALNGYSEISGVCTHPAHRGKGFAGNLIRKLAGDHRTKGLVSWLHVVSTNKTAIDLYQSLGFKTERAVTLSHVSRRA